MPKPSIKTPPPGYRFATAQERKRLPAGALLCTINGSWEESAMIGSDLSKSDWTYAVKDKTPRAKAPTSRIPDSGSRTNFSTGAVRDAAPGKGLPSRVPPAALELLERRFEDGATKYPDGPDGVPNWMKGIPLSRFFDAIIRHARKAARGLKDEDHFGAVMWNAAAWFYTQEEIDAGNFPKELNDLPFHPEGPVARKRKAKAKAKK